MIGRLVAKRFARALIQPLGNRLHLFIGDRREVAAFRKILSYQPVGILIEAALPTVIRMRKVEVGGKGFGNLGVRSELSAVI